VKDFTFTATFTDENLAQVLELMTLPTPVRYELIPTKKMTDGNYLKPKVIIGLKKNYKTGNKRNAYEKNDQKDSTN